MYNAQTAVAFGLTLATLSMMGCYNNETATHVQENHLKTAFSEKEQQTLRNNTVAIHTTKNLEAIAQLPQGFKFVNEGYFTVAVGTNSFPPLHVLAEDNQTRIGSEIDIAQLIADSLGLKLRVIPTSWENWPLGLASGKFDAVFSNIAVTEQRKQKYDFATYRQDMLAFYVTKGSKIQAIRMPDDIAGLKIVVGSGTNQERLLLNWIENNRQKGLNPAQPIYLEDGAAAALALQSGRVDAYLIPNVMGVWQQANGANIKAVGALDGTWSVAVAVKKGTGLVNAVQSSINGVIANGTYTQALSRWNLQNEGIPQSVINPLIQDK